MDDSASDQFVMQMKITEKLLRQSNLEKASHVIMDLAKHHKDLTLFNLMFHAADRYRVLAREKLENENYEEAIRYFRCSLFTSEFTIDDLRQEVICNVIHCFLQLGKELEAAAEAAKVKVFMSPPQVCQCLKYLSCQADKKLDSGNYKQAVAYCSSAEFLMKHMSAGSRLTFESKETPFIKALALFFLGKEDAAKSILKKDIPILEKRYSDMYKRGTRAEDEKRLEESIQFYKGCLFLGQKMTSREPSPQVLHACIANCWGDLRNYKEALTHMKQSTSASKFQSKDVATKWKNLGNEVQNSDGDDAMELAIEIYEQALAMCPKRDKDLRKKLLSNMSSMYYRMEKFTQAAYYANLCILTDSTWSKGHYRLGMAYSGKGKHAKAIALFSRSLDHSDKKDRKSMITALVTALGQAGTQRELPKSVTSQETEECLKSLLAAKDKLAFGALKWLLLNTPCDTKLYSGHIKMSDVVQLDSDCSLLKKLLEEKITCCNQDDDLWTKAVKAKNFLAVALLIQHRTPLPELCDVTENGAPLYVAVKLALHFGCLEILRQTWKTIDQSSIDEAGKSIIQLLASGLPSSHKVECLKFLVKEGFSIDGEQKTLCASVLDALQSSDERYSLIENLVSIPNQNEVKMEAPKKKKQKTKTRKDQKASSSSEGIKKFPAAAIGTKSAPITEIIYSSSNQAISSKVGKTNPRHKELLLELNKRIQSKDFDSQQFNTDKDELESATSTCEQRSEDCIPSHLSRSSSSAGEDLWSDAGDISMEDENFEVECTDQVFRVLKGLNLHARRKVAEVIAQLASDGSTQSTIRTEDSLPEVELYVTPVVEDMLVLWQKALAFSPRKSEVRQEHGQLMLRNKYDQVVRLWYVIFDKSLMPQLLKRIRGCYERGATCLVPRKLKRIGAEGDHNSTVCSLYEEISGTETISTKHLPPEKSSYTACGTKTLEGLVTFYPPASWEDREFHIIKFYSITSAFIGAVLRSDGSCQANFPFKVSDMENAVIRLEELNKSPTLLLGRSGTGKTTCCLYRLWFQFIDYWKKALQDGPLIKKKNFADTFDEETVSEEAPKPKGVSMMEEKEVVLPEPEEKISYVNSEESSLDKLLSGCQCQGACNCYVDCSEYQKPAFFGREVINISGKTYSEQNEDREDLDKLGTPAELASNDEFASISEDLGADEWEKPGYENLRQIFITKNHVLCGEVSKTFESLLIGNPEISPSFLTRSNKIPSTLADVDEKQYPFFLTSHQWLLLLDGSLPGKPFFPRDERGRLLCRIDGWNEARKIKSFLQEVDVDRLAENNEFSDNDTDSSQSENETEIKRKENVVTRKQEVTYEVFTGEFWREINKKVNVQCHPSLVWTEICSFIKGSAKAVRSEKGFLELKEYKALGRKYAPNFGQERDDIFKLFKRYQEKKRRQNMFDEADVFHNLYHRIKEHGIDGWSPHQVYIDETQDFCEAELILLIYACQNRNAIFLTGDTAQSITRGVSFRFEDVKSLFFQEASGSMEVKNGEEKLCVPKGVLQLVYNYRSHNGILDLASSVIDVLGHFFPKSFDKLRRDIGMFPGPKPILLETQNPTELAVILQGSKRNASSIEFGAHQVVLVADEETKQNIPDELSCALVLTILEAKGLEFDDVLLYNFFAASKAGDEWRLVKTYLDHLIESGKLDPDAFEENPLPMCGLTLEEEEELRFEVRPLEFDERKHKLLNTELKQLYTALTRARVNLWIFDENEERRGPIFEYFIKRKLVELIKIDSDDQESFSHQIFAKPSSAKDWYRRGKYFYEHGNWVVAATCFKRAEADHMEARCRAHNQAMKAYCLAVSPDRKDLKTVYCEYLDAAVQYVDTGLIEEAKQCVKIAKEWTILGEMHEKAEEFVDAGKAYTKAGKPLRASECFRKGLDYRNAADVLYKAGMPRETCHVLVEYKGLCSGGNLSNFKPPRSTMKLKEICYEAASSYYKKKDLTTMQCVLNEALSPQDQLEFFNGKDDLVEERIQVLTKLRCFEEAEKLLISENRMLEIARLWADGGFEEKKLDAFLANCQMIVCKSSAAKNNDLMIQDQPEVRELVFPFLTEIMDGLADESIHSAKKESLKAHVFLLRGIITGSRENVVDALKLFKKANDYIHVYAVHAYLLRANVYLEDDVKLSYWSSLEQVLRTVVFACFVDKKSESEEKIVKEGQAAIGWLQNRVKGEDRLQLREPWKFELICLLMGSKMASSAVDVSISDGREVIASLLLKAVQRDVLDRKKRLISRQVSQKICPKFLGGLHCHGKCGFLHVKASKAIMRGQCSTLWDIVALDSICQGFCQKVDKGNGKVREVCELALRLTPMDPRKPFDKLFDLWRTYLPELGHNNIRATDLYDCLTTLQSWERKGMRWYMQSFRKEHSSQFIDITAMFKVVLFSHTLGVTPSFCDLIVGDQISFLCQEWAEKRISSETPAFFPSDNDACRPKKPTLLFKHFILSKDVLYNVKKLLPSLKLSTFNFLAFTVSKNKTFKPLDTDIFLSLVERDVTLCCLVAARNGGVNSKGPQLAVLLPNSYLENMFFWYKICKPVSGTKIDTMYDGFAELDSQNPDQVPGLVYNKVIQFILQFLNGTWSPKMNLLKMLESVEPQKRVADRIVLLICVVLFNARKLGMCPEEEARLVKYIRQLKVFNGLDQRVKDAFTGIQESSSPQLLIPVWEKFLRETGNCSVTVRWPKGEQEPLFDRQFDSDRSKEYEKLAAEAAPGGQDFLDWEGNSPHNPLGTDKVTVLQRKASESQDNLPDETEDEDSLLARKALASQAPLTLERLNKAAKKIQACCRAHLDKTMKLKQELQHEEQQQLKQGEETVADAPDVSDDSDEHVNETGCGICGISFNLRSAKVENQKRLMHVQSEKHRETKVNRDNFVMYEESCVIPLLESSESLLDKVDDLKEKGVDFSEYKEELDGIRRQVNALSTTLDGLKEKRLWTEQEIMSKAVCNLNEASYQFEKVVDSMERALQGNPYDDFPVVTSGRKKSGGGGRHGPPSRNQGPGGGKGGRTGQQGRVRGKGGEKRGRGNSGYKHTEKRR